MRLQRGKDTQEVTEMKDIPESGTKAAHQQWDTLQSIEVARESPPCPHAPRGDRGSWIWGLKCR